MTYLGRLNQTDCNRIHQTSASLCARLAARSSFGDLSRTTSPFWASHSRCSVTLRMKRSRLRLGSSSRKTSIKTPISDSSALGAGGIGSGVVSALTHEQQGRAPESAVKNRGYRKACFGPATEPDGPRWRIAYGQLEAEA